MVLQTTLFGHSSKRTFFAANTKTVGRLQTRPIHIRLWVPAGALCITAESPKDVRFQELYNLLFGLSWVSGGARTHNLLNHNQLRCQLRHTHHIYNYCTPRGIRTLIVTLEESRPSVERWRHRCAPGWIRTSDLLLVRQALLNQLSYRSLCLNTIKEPLTWYLKLVMVIETFCS